MPRNAGDQWLGGSREKLVLLGIFLLALTLRLIYLYQVRANPLFDCPMGDPWYHDEWAREIGGGDWIGSQVFFRAPLYPYFLGLIYSVCGHSCYIPRVIQFLIGSLSVVLLYAVTAKFFSKRVALIASLIASMYGIFVYFEGELLIPVLLVPLNLGLIYLLIVAEERPSFWRWLFSGAILGISALARPNILLFVPFVLLWAYLNLKEKGGKRALALCLSFLVGVGLTVFPVTLRNYLVGRDPVLIAYQGGVNFYVGNNPEADGKTALMPKGEDPKDQLKEWGEGLGRQIKPSLESRLWYRKGLSFARERPKEYLRLLLKKCVLFWNGYEIRNNQDIYFVRRYSSLFSRLVWRADGFPPFGLSFPFGILAPLALTGMILSLSEWKRLMLIWLFVGSYFVSVVLFFVCSRYRVPILPFLIGFAAFALWWWYERLRTKRLRQFALSLILFLVFYALVNSNFYGVKDENDAFAHFYLGNAFYRKGYYGEALAQFERTVEIDSNYPYGHLNWGATHYRLGNLKLAEEHFRRELVLNPAEERAYNYIGLVKQREGKNGEAVNWFEKALEVRSDFTEARVNLGITYESMGKNQQAISHLEEAIELDPTLASAHNILGRLHLQEGSIDRALGSFQKAVMSEAGNPTYRYNLGLAYASKGMLNLASEQFERATELDPLFAEAHANLGNAYLAVGKLDEAIESLREALSLNPQLAEVHFNLGVAFMRKGLEDSSRAEFDKAVELEPALLKQVERFK